MYLMTNNHQVVSTRKDETMKAQRIEGAVALVTGANRGIGRALTEALLTRGVRKVYATARNPEALRALRDERLGSTSMAQVRLEAPVIATVAPCGGIGIR